MPLYLADGPANVLLGTLIGADMNSTGDQAFTMLRRPRKWRYNNVFATNASISLTTAAGGLYTATSKGGSAFVASSQAYSTLTDADKLLTLTAAAPSVADLLTDELDLYLSLTTGQGAASTADFYLYGIVFEW